jgi:hypothetical protein
MKKSSIIICSFLSGIFLIGCKKEFKPVAEYEIPNKTTSMLKINFTSTYRSNPNVQISLNDTRVSNLITSRTPFPGGGYNTNGDNRPDYLNLNPGSTKVGIAIPKALTNIDSVKLFNATVSLESGKYYTLHTADTAANTKYVLVEDNISGAPVGSFKFKFINLMPDVPAIDLYYGSTIMASNVPYLGITNVFTMPVPAISLAWTIRPTGTSATSTALATYSSTNTTLSTRSYTAFAMGYKSVTSTSDARRPFISFFLNR